MPQPKFYFAFPDRAYHYDCAACDALCCRGHGIGTAVRETPTLLQHYPALAWAATRSGPAGSDFTNPAGGCFFLTNQNLCQIEVDHGRSAKPGVCVLFPFNDFTRLGHVIVVRPHFLCPLHLRPGEGAGDHAELEKQLQETGMETRALAQPGSELSSTQTQQILHTEENFRDRCGAAIGKVRFEDLLESSVENKTAFRAWQQRALRLWGIAHEAAPRDALDEILLALASPLRTHLFFASERRRLRILFLASAYARIMARVTSRPLTLQGTHRLIMDILPLLRLFARGNTAIRLRAPEAQQGVEFQNPELTLAFFQVLEDLQGGHKLFDTVERALPKRLSPIERGLFFHQLARRVRELKPKRA